MTSKRGDDDCLLLRPLPMAAGDVAEPCFTLAGGPLLFRAVEVMGAGGAAPDIRPFEDALELLAARRGRRAAATLMARLTEAPAPPHPIFAGAAPLIMGIVNVTPDSFSDGGRFSDPGQAADHARALVEAGADIVDIGGESTRPGAEAPPPGAELDRVLPVIEALTDLDKPISIDTRSAEVMRRALAAGATVVNDVSALSHDPEAIDTVARAGAPVILMHSRGTPATMNGLADYRDVAAEVMDELSVRVEAALGGSIARDRIILDPGFGFAKTGAHNLALLARLALLHGLGRPLVAGLSRKRFIADLHRDAPADRRLGGSLAAGLAALEQGARVLRVHDVAETHQAATIWRAIRARDEDA